MRLAFALFKYSPYGGLQRDALRIAQACARRGHQVTVYTTRWEGEKPKSFETKLLPVKGVSNHRRYLSFARAVQAALATQPADLVVGFNKIPGLDVYYAGDFCFAEKAFRDRPLIYRLTPRCRQLLALERSVFEKGADTKILSLSEIQRENFRRYYQTSPERFYPLPPGISRDRVTSDDYPIQRRKIRYELSIGYDEKVLLALGSGFKTKGLERSIRVLADLPGQLKTKLIVVGRDNPRSFLKLAKRYGVAHRVRFLSARDDVPALLQAGDVLLHPAHRENTGTVLLEALVAGLPVVATDVCGYAHYVSESDMGEVLPSPFDEREYCRAVERVLAPPRDQWRERGKRFAESADIYDLHERACSVIESLARERCEPRKSRK